MLQICAIQGRKRCYEDLSDHIYQSLVNTVFFMVSFHFGLHSSAQTMTPATQSFQIKVVVVEKPGEISTSVYMEDMKKYHLEGLNV